MGYGSRKPDSNDQRSIANKNRWGPKDGIRDEFSVLLNGEAIGCFSCKQVIMNEYLRYQDGVGYCPDCFNLD